MAHVTGAAPHASLNTCCWYLAGSQTCPNQSHQIEKTMNENQKKKQEHLWNAMQQNGSIEQQNGSMLLSHQHVLCNTPSITRNVLSYNTCILYNICCGDITHAGYTFYMTSCVI
jgi:hypothetical protein